MIKCNLWFQLIPDYDKRLDVSEEDESINVTEHRKLLNLRLSYVWNHIVGEDLHEILVYWLYLFQICPNDPKCNDAPTPFFILLGKN